MPAVARQRLWLLAAPLCMLGNPLIGNAADFASLGSRLDGDLKALSSGKSEGGGMSPSADVFPILSAREDVKKLLADEETFRTMVSIGLPTGNLQMVHACNITTSHDPACPLLVLLPSCILSSSSQPPIILFNLFKRLEPTVRDPDEFMDAAMYAACAMPAL